MPPGFFGAIIGSAIGVMGGAIGCGVVIMNTTKPRERALVIRFLALTTLWLVVPSAWMFLAPSPWSSMGVLLVLPALRAIPWMNRRAREARALDQADARGEGTAS